MSYKLTVELSETQTAVIELYARLKGVSPTGMALALFGQVLREVLTDEVIAEAQAAQRKYFNAYLGREETL